MILIGWSSPHCATDFVVQHQLPFFHQQTVDKIKIFRYFSIFVKSRNMKICDVIIDMICQFLVEYVYFFRSSKDAPLKESQKPQSRHNYFLINYCKSPKSYKMFPKNITRDNVYLLSKFNDQMIYNLPNPVKHKTCHSCLECSIMVLIRSLKSFNWAQMHQNLSWNVGEIVFPMVGK